MSALLVALFGLALIGTAPPTDVAFIGIPGAGAGSELVAVSSDGSERHLKCDALGNFVPSWNGFAAALGDDLICLTRSGMRTVAVLPGVGRADAFAVSPDGRDVAEYFNETGTVTMERLADKRTLWSRTIQDLRKSGFAVMMAETPEYEADFSADGKRLAVGLPSLGKRPWDNMVPACSVSFDTKTGAARFEGTGEALGYYDGRLVRLTEGASGDGRATIGRSESVLVRRGQIAFVSNEGVITGSLADRLLTFSVWSIKAGHLAQATFACPLGKGFIIVAAAGK